MFYWKDEIDSENDMPGFFLSFPSRLKENLGSAVEKNKLWNYIIGLARCTQTLRKGRLGDVATLYLCPKLPPPHLFLCCMSFNPKDRPPCFIPVHNWKKIQEHNKYIDRADSLAFYCSIMVSAGFCGCSSF